MRTGIGTKSRYRKSLLSATVRNIRNSSANSVNQTSDSEEYASLGVSIALSNISSYPGDCFCQTLDL